MAGGPLRHPTRPEVFISPPIASRCRRNPNDVHRVNLARSKRHQGTHHRLRSRSVSSLPYGILLISQVDDVLSQTNQAVAECMRIDGFLTPTVLNPATLQGTTMRMVPPSVCQTSSVSDTNLAIRPQLIPFPRLLLLAGRRTFPFKQPRLSRLAQNPGWGTPRETAVTPQPTLR